MSARAGSLCSGVGGLDLAIEDVFGAETVWQAEVDPHASTVLDKRWPGVPDLGDITAVDWSKVEPVDVLSGGTPCQDMSSAGRRAGMRPGTRSGLWSAMADAIYQLRPRVVVWENVEGALSACAHSDLEPCPGCVGDGPHEPVLRAPGRVLGDLADLGYDAAWQVVAASSVGACHRRRRLFVVAVAADAGGERLREHAGGALGEETGSDGRHVARDHRGALAVGDGWPDRVGIPSHWGRYAAAVARHEAMLGRPAPSPTMEGRNGTPVLSHRFTEWMMCWPDGWVSDLLDRRPGLRCCGNGVVPAQAAAAIVSLLGAFGTEVSR